MSAAFMGKPYRLRMPNLLGPRGRGDERDHRGEVDAQSRMTLSGRDAMTGPAEVLGAFFAQPKNL